MPAKSSQAQHSGCRVSGVWLDAAGQPVAREIRFAPQGGGRGAGAGNVQYSAEPVRVQPDSSGRWAVTLAPSSVVGLYRVVFSGRPAVEATIAVPDRAAAEYGEIVR